MIEVGQLLSASFMDYAMPRADNLCNISIVSNPSPTPSQSARRQGWRRGGDGRRAAVGDDRDPGCVEAAWGHGTGDAGSPQRVWRAIHDAAG